MTRGPASGPGREERRSEPRAPLGGTDSAQDPPRARRRHPRARDGSRTKQARHAAGATPASPATHPGKPVTTQARRIRVAHATGPPRGRGDARVARSASPVGNERTRRRMTERGEPPLSPARGRSCQPMPVSIRNRRAAFSPAIALRSCAVSRASARKPSGSVGPMSNG